MARDNDPKLERQFYDLVDPLWSEYDESMTDDLAPLCYICGVRCPPELMADPDTCYDCAMEGMLDNDPN